MDIISIDKKIKDKYLKSNENIKELENKYNNIKSYMDNLEDEKNIALFTKVCENLQTNITDIRKNKELNYYIMDSFEILDKFKKILNKPIKMSFSTLR